MASAQSFESPENIQYFLAILQGYSSRITKHQDVARFLSEEHKQLQEMLADLRKQIEQGSARLKKQQELISWQAKLISFMEGGPLPAAGWQVDNLQAESEVVVNERTTGLDGLETPRGKKRRLDPPSALDTWEVAAAAS